MQNSFLQSAIKQFEYYKSLGEKTFNQIDEQKLFWQYNNESNSIAIIVTHLYGNMLSRWTDFLTTDGEKDWRNRDAEFELKIIYEPDQNKHDLNCWKGFQNEIKAESTITIPIYRTFNTKTDLRTGKAGKHWLDYLLGIICLRVDRKQFDVLLSDIPQERLEYLIKRLRVILENTIYQERFMQLERLKNKE